MERPGSFQPRATGFASAEPSLVVPIAACHWLCQCRTVVGRSNRVPRATGFASAEPSLVVPIGCQQLPESFPSHRVGLKVMLRKLTAAQAVLSGRTTTELSPGWEIEMRPSATLWYFP